MVTVFDLEADNLLLKATRLWVAAWKSGEEVRHTVDTFDALLSTLEESDTVVGHNILNYDLPLLSRLYGFILPRRVEVVDTLVWSRLFYPDLAVPEGWKGKPHPHSLEAWMMRMGMKPKVHNDNWSQFDPVMVERCKDDVVATEELYKLLEKEYES